MYVARDQNEILQELQRQSGIEASKIEGTFENAKLSSSIRPPLRIHHGVNT